MAQASAFVINTAYLDGYTYATHDDSRQIAAFEALRWERIEDGDASLHEVCAHFGFPEGEIVRAIKGIDRGDWIELSHAIRTCIKERASWLEYDAHFFITAVHTPTEQKEAA